MLKMDDAMVVAINSADYCWTKEEGLKTKWDEVMPHSLTGRIPKTRIAKRALAEQELMKLRTKDIHEVDKEQLKALKERLEKAGHRARTDNDRHLRIAAMHHPIVLCTAPRRSSRSR